MSLATLRPSGDGTTTGWTRVAASGTFASKIVDDPDSHDGDTSYVQGPNNSNGEMFVELDEVPGEFNPADITSITIKVAARKNEGGVVQGVDTVDLFAQLFLADETTALSDESTVANITDAVNYTLVTRTVALSGAPSLSDWNGARLRLRQAYTRVQMEDTTTQIRVTAAEIEVEYQAIAVPTISAVGTAGAFEGGETDVPITGTNFGPSQGTGTVELADSSTYETATKVPQTVTSWANTAIEFTADIGGLTPGTLWLYVTNNGGTRSDGFEVTVSAGEAAPRRGRLGWFALEAPGVGAMTHVGAATLLGGSSIQADAWAQATPLTAAASLQGSSQLTASAQVITQPLSGTATLTGGSVLTASATLQTTTLTGAATLLGASVLSADATVQATRLSASALLLGGASVTGDAALRTTAEAGSATLLGGGVVQASGQLISGAHEGQAVLVGSATLTAAATVRDTQVLASATLMGGALVTAEAQLAGVPLVGGATLLGGAVVEASAAVKATRLDASATFVGASEVTADASLQASRLQGTASLTGASLLTADANLTTTPLLGQALLMGGGTVLAGGQLVGSALVGASTLYGASVLTGAATVRATRQAAAAILMGGSVLTANGIVLEEPPLPPQFARPMSDVLTSGWETHTGATTNLYQQINEETADDADYIRTSDDVESAIYVTKLTSATDPEVSTGYVMRYTYGKNQAEQQVVNLLVQLRQDYVDETTQGTLIRGVVHEDVGVFSQTAAIALTTEEAESITDHENLYLRLIRSTP